MASKAKYALMNAFLDLVNTEDFDKISVTCLVEKCHISRQTFYYHFDDIESMLTWAFAEENDKICNHQQVGKWRESAEMYVDFLNRYDMLIRKAAVSPKALFVNNLLFNGFEKYITAYIRKKQGDAATESEEARFYISFWAAGITELILLEVQKEESHYGRIAKKIGVALKLMP